MKNDWKLVHIICKYTKSTDLLKYIIANKIDLTCKTSTGWNAIHMLYYYSTYEIIVQAVAHYILTWDTVDRIGGELIRNKYGIKELLIKNSNIMPDQTLRLIEAIQKIERAIKKKSKNKSVAE